MNKIQTTPIEALVKVNKKEIFTRFAKNHDLSEFSLIVQPDIFETFQVRKKQTEQIVFNDIKSNHQPVETPQRVSRNQSTELQLYIGSRSPSPQANRGAKSGTLEESKADQNVQTDSEDKSHQGTQVSFLKPETPPNRLDFLCKHTGAHFRYGELGLFLIASQEAREHLMNDPQGLPVNSSWRQTANIFQKDNYEQRFTENFSRLKCKFSEESPSFTDVPSLEQVKRFQIVEINVNDMTPQLAKISAKETQKLRKFESLLKQSYQMDYFDQQIINEERAKYKLIAKERVDYIVRQQILDINEQRPWNVQICSIEDKPGVNDYQFWNANSAELIKFFSIQIFRQNQSENFKESIYLSQMSEFSGQKISIQIPSQKKMIHESRIFDSLRESPESKQQLEENSVDRQQFTARKRNYIRKYYKNNNMFKKVDRNKNYDLIDVPQPHIVRSYGSPNGSPNFNSMNQQAPSSKNTNKNRLTPINILNFQPDLNIKLVTEQQVRIEKSPPKVSEIRCNTQQEGVRAIKNDRRTIQSECMAKRPKLVNVNYSTFNQQIINSPGTILQSEISTSNMSHQRAKSTIRTDIKVPFMFKRNGQRHQTPQNITINLEKVRKFTCFDLSNINSTTNQNKSFRARKISVVSPQQAITPREQTFSPRSIEVKSPRNTNSKIFEAQFQNHMIKEKQMLEIDRKQKLYQMIRPRIEEQIKIPKVPEPPKDKNELLIETCGFSTKNMFGRGNFPALTQIEPKIKKQVRFNNSPKGYQPNTSLGNVNVSEVLQKIRQLQKSSELNSKDMILTEDSNEIDPLLDSKLQDFKFFSSLLSTNSRGNRVKKMNEALFGEQENLKKAQNIMVMNLKKSPEYDERASVYTCVRADSKISKNL